MLTIDISVNGKTVYARTATNTGKRNKLDPNYAEYKLDTGEIILHDPVEGIMALVEKIVKTIKE
jgi:alpha-D-ribose 1-methylphosphonate 5-triphosphate synthase subunit PhnL